MDLPGRYALMRRTRQGRRRVRTLEEQGAAPELAALRASDAPTAVRAAALSALVRLGAWDAVRRAVHDPHEAIGFDAAHALRVAGEAGVRSPFEERVLATARAASAPWPWRKSFTAQYLDLALDPPREEAAQVTVEIGSVPELTVSVGRSLYLFLWLGSDPAPDLEPLEGIVQAVVTGGYEEWLNPRGRDSGVLRFHPPGREAWSYGCNVLWPSAPEDWPHRRYAGYA